MINWIEKTLGKKNETGLQPNNFPNTSPAELKLEESASRMQAAGTPGIEVREITFEEFARLMAKSGKKVAH